MVQAADCISAGHIKTPNHNGQTLDLLRLVQMGIHELIIRIDVTALAPPS
jgi:hypothetical protein